MTTRAALIEVQGLCVELGGRLALEDVTLTVAEGDYVGLIGPNGGGKTTLLRTLLGACVPVRGSVRLGGRTPQQAALLGWVGYVPQRLTTLEADLPLSVDELLRNALHLRPAVARAPELSELLARLRLEPLRHRLLAELSGGERQRAFIARALLSSPRVLLLDEPTTGVDAEAQEEFYGLLRSIHADGVTIILCSHDTDVVIREATHVVALQRRVTTACSTRDAACQQLLQGAYGDHVHHVHHGHACSC